jgi:hypothetical protein
MAIKYQPNTITRYRQLAQFLGGKDILGNGTAVITYDEHGNRTGSASLHPYGIEARLGNAFCVIDNDGTILRSNDETYAQWIVESAGFSL